MGWFAAAGCTLIASVFLFQLYLRRSSEVTKPEIFVQEETEYTKTFNDSDELREPEISDEPVSSSDDGDDEDVAAQGTTRQPQQGTSNRPGMTHILIRNAIHKTTTKNAMLPPPPRPASTPLPQSAAASAAPHRANMPPPSSLPPSRSRSPPRLKPPTASASPRGPPTLNGGGSGGGLRPPPSSASSLRVPAQKVLQNTKMQPSLSAAAASASTLPPSQRPSRKVVLSPGHSPLDWAALQRSPSPSTPTKLRGKDATSFVNGSPVALLRVTPSMLKRQTGRKGKDAWTSYQGRVYNLSAYLPFHPGGEPEMMKGAGGKSDELFAEVHPWVNWEGMLGECCIGILVSEEDGQQQQQGKSNGAANALDEMD